MPFGKHTLTKLAWIPVALLVSAPLVAFSAPTTDDLNAVKDQFDSLWKSASETGRRRAALEQNLAGFDVRVAAAKEDLMKAASDRKNVREQIAERKKLMDVLGEQLHAAAEARGLYQALAMSQKDDIVAFVRYLDGRNIALRESGPVNGGSLLRSVIRGSLGETIETELADHALLTTRRHFSSQIGVLVAEADKAEKRIKTVLSQLNDEIDGLEERGKYLSDTVNEKAAYIDDSWRQKQLNEEELQHVLQETAEANAKISEMQSSLLTIHEQLKQDQLKQLQEDLDSFTSDRTRFADQLLALKRKDAAMSLLQQAADDALLAMQALRNTDKKIYRRIEDAELRLQQLRKDVSASTSSGALSGSLQTDIADLVEHIALMKTGVPADSALDYVQKRRQAMDGAAARAQYAVQITELSLKIDALDASIDVKKNEIASVQSSDALSGLPPMFSWPVHGTVTAGYFDPDYQKVFNVPHRAVDIAVPQATPLRTVSQGIVYAVKDGGLTGYSYILIGHAGGYASLYGHVSASFVKAGDKVGYGQVIGLTGGQPGSHGAGHMTTGAHLHLEMMKNGVHLNPLSVLTR